MPRGRRRKFRLHLNIRGDTIRSVVAMLLILSALISLISFFVPNYPFNEQVLKIQKEILGTVAIFVPVILGMVGFLFIDKMQPKLKEVRILSALIILTLCLSGLFHVFNKLEDYYKIAKNGEGGGLVGYKVASVLVGSMSVYGAVSVLIILAIISVFVLFNISLDRIIKFAVEHKPSIDLKNFKFSLPNLSKKESEDEDLEVTTGFLSDQGEGSLSEESKVESEKDVTSFELIPSMAEPQQLPLLGRGKSPESLYAETPHIPKLPPDRIWQTPPLDLLLDPPSEVRDTSDVDRRSKIIKDTLKSFGIEVEIDNTKVGPTVTQYSLQPRSVTKISKIASLHEDLALALASPTGSVRIEAPIPGKSLIGIEVPNTNRTNVFFKPLLTSDPMKGIKSKLAIVLGKDVGGKTYVYDIAKMPHILIAGTTGSGKSIFIHNIMLSILYRANPQEVKFILVDPKRVEFSHYQGLPHLITPVVTDMDQAPSVFRWAVVEMDKRYRLFEQAKVSNIDQYNERSGIQVMPYIMIVVDELGEIMLKDPTGVEKSIIRVAQLARATGIHLILAVQRPSINVVTGLIKANISCRVAFNVASQIDSRVIIDQPGAEKLLGRGDMLFIPPDASKPTRLQGAYVKYEEVDAVVGFLKSQGVDPDYKEDVISMTADRLVRGGKSDWGEGVDDKFDEAVDIVQSLGRASASLLQRKLAIGYARAARIIDEMEEKGIIGPPAYGSKARDIIMRGGPIDLSESDLEVFDEPK
jgi:S-DNA-T family DNA segregation ATPase FtsK/SpoIIIE